MKYFKSNNEVYAYDEQQLAQAYSKDMTPMTDAEVELHINPPKTAEQLAEEAKAERLKQLEVLTVTTTNGNTFDANNQARLDMSDGISSANTLKEMIDLGILPTDTVWDRTIWRMADNSEVEITLMELKEASLLALKAYASIKGIV